MASFMQFLAEATLAYVQLQSIREREIYIRMEPWKEEPIGPEFGYMLRVSSEGGKTTGYIERNIPLEEPDEGFIWPETGYVLEHVTAI